MRPDKTKAEQRGEEKVIVTAGGGGGEGVEGVGGTHGFVRADCVTSGIAFACLPYFTVTSAAPRGKVTPQRERKPSRRQHSGTCFTEKKIKFEKKLKVHRRVQGGRAFAD